MPECVACVPCMTIDCSWMRKTSILVLSDQRIWLVCSRQVTNTYTSAISRMALQQTYHRGQLHGLDLALVQRLWLVQHNTCALRQLPSSHQVW